MCPMYEYICSKAHLFERFESIVGPEDPRPIKCPKCGKRRKCTKVFSKTGTPILKEGRGGFFKPTKP